MINKRYVITKKIGQGRSKVFSVIDTEFPEREVAVKFLPFNSPDEEKKSFRDEFFTLKKLDHPNIIKAFEFNTVLSKDDEDSEIEFHSPFITLEYFSGSELLEYRDIYNEKKLIFIIKQICSVLYYLHQSNYIYYDLKPENILIADVNGEPIIKIIDLGLSQYILKEYEHTVKGTAYYIAPELLKNEIHDHTVDFYSLGMILYRIVYGKFPFESDDQLEIYKSHIEEEFIFPESNYSEKFIKIIQKLIKKNPVERYNNALQIIVDLGLTLDLEVVKDIIPAKVFSDRKDAYNILTTYLNDKTSTEVFTVRGFDGSGKTSLLLEINENNPISVFIENTKTKTGMDAIKYIFQKIIFSEILYSETKSNYENTISGLFNGKSYGFIENIKQILNNLAYEIELIILLDDFNLYDNLTREVLLEIIPILQIKKVKIILSESSDYDHSASALSNLCDIQLSQFTDHQLSEFLDLSYSPTFPKRELKKFILLYADLLPGNIKQFIKDLIILRVMQFNADSVNFSASEDIVLALQSSHEEIYRLRLSNLKALELKLAQIISAFDISIEQTVLASLIDIPLNELKLELNELEKKNIISPLNISNAPQINSFGFKKYIYSTISNKVKFHIVLANSIKRLFPDFNTIELSRQFELANEFERSVEVLQKEIGRAEEISAFKYKKTLLERALSFNLVKSQTNKLRVDLVNTLFKLSDFKASIDNIYKLSIDELKDSEKNEINFIKGSSLISLRKIEEGKKILNVLKSAVKNKNLESKIIVELAYAEFDQNNLDAASELCHQIIKNQETFPEDKGKCFNLLGIIESQFKNNAELALEYFFNALNYFESTKKLEELVKINLNIGNIYSLIGKKENAEKSWDKAIKLNTDIGNLNMEALALMNYGVYYQENNKYEQAINNWLHSESIYETIGNLNGKGLVMSNLGELYFQTCEYQNSFDYLSKALTIFRELDNKEEEINTLFLLGRFWFIIGDIEELDKIVNKYEYHLYTEENLSEKFQINYNYLKLMKNALDIKVTVDTLEFLKILSKSSELGEMNLYVEILFFYVELLINVLKFDDAIKYLNDKLLLKQIEHNVLYRAKREYLYGRIAQISRNKDLKSPIDYYENAYSLLEDQSINELTWKVLFTMAEAFWDRGNIQKAKKPRTYAFELLNMISDHITNNKIRNAYIERVDRKQAFEKLKLMANPTPLNEYQKS
jgi:serine/threonine protein kinase